ncbi:MAG: hypothetical protein WCV73_02515 [Patescibacteria group bacterium]|jgi:predicted glutamine amidotransferase
MCRFLIINQQEPKNIQEYLVPFATSCQQSERWQGDGWGISWLDKGVWKTYYSLKPIWEDQKNFSQIPISQLFLIHARGSSFPKDKGNLEYNQPFIKGNLAFVFNGFLNGVKLSQPIEGKVGSQKIFNLLLSSSGSLAAEKLQQATNALLGNSSIVEALNIGLATPQEIILFNHFITQGTYHQLYNYHTNNLRLVSLEPFGDFAWQALPHDQVINIPVL